MHTCALIALPAKSDECLFRWRVKAAGGGHFEVIDLDNGLPVDGAWTEVCMERVRRAAAGDPTAVELVICPIGDELVARRDINAFEDFLAVLRDSAWGARVFIALSTRIQLTRDLLDSKSTLDAWLQTAGNARVADLFHIDYDPARPSSISPLQLWDAICSTEPRRQFLGSLYPSSRLWYCVPPAKLGALAALIGRAPTSALPNSDLVLVIDESDPGFQRHYIEKKAKRFRDHQLIVVTLSAPPSQELNSWCEDHGLAPPIEMRGEFELAFFLLRLNFVRKSLPPPTRRIAPVPRTPQNAAFLPNASPTKVLFTSAFDEEEEEHCVAAACDFGVIFAGVPVELPYHVEPCITIQRLTTVLSAHPDLNIWIHSGHGEPYRGLHEAGPDNGARVQNWLHCFRAQKLRLDLAIFLTCYSSAVARRFVRAGVGVAIGFEGQVGTNAARHVAASLLMDVLQGGVRKNVILDSLARGFERYQGVDWSQCKPKAYYLPRR